jgi:CheY-like chemotaxis protein
MEKCPIILIIDEVADNIKMPVHALDYIAEVRFALPGAHGLERAREQLPDLGVAGRHDADHEWL